MNNGDGAVPFDDSDFDQGAGLVGADEHRHRIVLHEVPDRETERMEHHGIRDAVPVGTVKDDRFRPPVRKFTRHKLSCQA